MKRSNRFTDTSVMVAWLCLALGLAVTATWAASPLVSKEVELGLVALSEGRMTEAHQLFQQALEADPDDPLACYGMGSLAMALGQYRAAAAHLTVADELFREQAEELRDGLSSYQSQRQTDQVAVRDMLADPQASSRNYRFFNTLDDDSATADVLNAAVSAGRPADLDFKLGTCLLRLGQPEAARGRLLAARDRAPSQPAVHVNLAVAELQLGHAAEADRLLDRAVELGGAVPEALRQQVDQSLGR